MWSETLRKMRPSELNLIMSLCESWSDEYLRSVEIREFLVDNAHTIRNASSIDERMKLVNSKLINDEDGAVVDVIVYRTTSGDFGELEINRVDTKPLILKTKFLQK